ncbi:diguanylate cyclase [uncultured Litoreibacter sp.]|uniref:sensor domain-containing diguanylate cyclase n=1 Tax=uncultured Litoreibacter sp. TaxID=1392394 RepID=UPI0026312272|nr:diguanylate cyclase [uncultured Litoreibacter sp.]
MTKPVPKREFDQYAIMAAEFSRDALLVTDREDRIVWLNRGFELLTGFTLNEMLGGKPGDFLRGDVTESATIAKIEDCITNRRPVDIEVQYRRKDGTPFWMESRITPVFDPQGNHTHFMSSSRDVTARRALEKSTKEATENEQLRQQERRLLSQVSEWLYSAKSLDELLLVIAKSLETLMPEAEGQLYIYSNSRDSLDLNIQWGGTDTAPKQIEADDCWALRRGRAYSFGMRPIEFPCAHSHAAEDDSPYFCVPITAHGQTNGLLHLDFGGFAPDRAQREKFKYFLDQRWELALLCAEQISLAIANVQLRQELLDQSVRDPLTNLWNRRWFLEAAHRQVNVARTNGANCSVISIDVDHFKKFNDHHGHDAGDLVLRALGAKMIEFFTENAAPCRLGGEEFIVLCTDMSQEQTHAMAEQFRKQVASLSVKYSGESLPKITVSAGVAVWPSDGAHVADLVKSADLALYKAKELGRNRVQSYTPED